MPMAPTTPEPRIAFLVGGVQKAGTSALAQYLRASPGLRLPADKEAHVFDGPDFDEGWSPAEVDAHHAHKLPGDVPGTLLGDATPFYLFHPRCVARIARYNPAMRWIVLLRDPVERARSQHHMERERGHERLPLWLAVLLERRRLRGHADDLARGSRLRRCSYRAATTPASWTRCTRMSRATRCCCCAASACAAIPKPACTKPAASSG